MSKRIDRTGRRYGRLTVVEYAGKDCRGKLLWKCKCDCGNEKNVVSDNLSSGKSNSCGCLKREFLSNPSNHFKRIENREEAILKIQYSHIKRRNKKFDNNMFPFEEFIKKSKSPCYYCGMEYSKILYDRQDERKDGRLISNTVVKVNGIDRIDNRKGYTVKNTVPCCKFCNTAKNTMTQEEFKNWITRVYKNFIGIELEQEYFDIVEKRIEECMKAKIQGNDCAEREA